MKRLRSLVLVATIFVATCTSPPSPEDPNHELPSGDPAFPVLGNSWVIDNAGVLSGESKSHSNAMIQQLRADGVAEVVVLVMNGIKHPEEYTTHYGRWAKLGRAGSSTEGGNNGVVWLVRPDAKEKLTISVGRGLPKFTSSDYGKIMEGTIDYFNFGNYNTGVKKLVEMTNQVLRDLYRSEAQ